MIPPSTPTLDTLVALGESQARSVLLGTKKELAPSWLLWCPNEKHHLFLTPWNGDLEKALARAYIREKIKEVGAVAYSVVLEAWMVVLQKGSRSMIDRVSEDPRREECITIMATDGFHQQTKTLRIVRDKVTGKCKDLPEFDQIKSMGGSREESIMDSPFLDLLTTLQ